MEEIATNITNEEDAKSQISNLEQENEYDAKNPEYCNQESNLMDVAHETIDYDEVIAKDLEILRSEFPELSGLSDITQLDNPIRYAALRDIGLDPTEAYLATTKRSKNDTRSHLTVAYGKNATSPKGMMSQRELSEAREIFSGLADSEIQRLYRKVTT